MDWVTGGSAPLSRTEPARGTNQAGLRAYNARLLLSLVRRHGALSKAEMARLTGLTPQTISVIVRMLEEKHLLARGAPKRGKVGQPLVPFRLDPAGASFLGLKIGRRSCDLVLMDLAGHIQARATRDHAWPVPSGVLAFVEEEVANFPGLNRADGRSWIEGLGIAIPFELWNWEDAVGAPVSVMAAWRDFDSAAELEARFGWPVHVCNDATAACAAELVLGSGHLYPDHIYFFISYFVGGGVVLNGSLRTGHTGNAGAVGSMPVTDAKGEIVQLIRLASLYVLEKSLRQQGQSADILRGDSSDWAELGGLLDGWISQAAAALAQAVRAAGSVFDFSAAIIDGAMPPGVRLKLCAAVRANLEASDRRGLSPLTIVPGTIGAPARALGAASLPLLANFAIDRNVLFKDDVQC